MRRIEFKASFDRLYRKHGPADQEKIDKAIETVLSALEAKKLPGGLGLKRLKENVWEIRVDLSLRVGFRMHQDLIEFGVVGNHEVIKKFLKNF